MHIIPTKIERQTEPETGAGTGITVYWNNGSTSVLSAEKLRKDCPCAECQEKRGEAQHAKPLLGRRVALRVISSTLDEALNLTAIWSIGNYAIGIKWGDGHSSGIYSWTVLSQLSNESSHETSTHRP